MNKQKYFIGAGTKNDPFLISSARDLHTLSFLINNNRFNNNETYFLQTRDIDLCGSKFNQFTSIGLNTIIKFNSNYNGANYHIKNLYISNKTDNNPKGLFGVTDKGSTIKNVYLMHSFINGKNFVGALVGKNNGTIKNSYIYNKSQIEGDSFVGALVGANSGYIFVCASIENSIFANKKHAGALIGFNYSNTDVHNKLKSELINDFYNKNGGGIVECSGVTNCVCYGGKNVGALIGTNQNGYIYVCELKNNAISGYENVRETVGSFISGKMVETYPIKTFVEKIQDNSNDDKNILENENQLLYLNVDTKDTKSHLASM
jgi:hypothetical protein